MTNMDTKASAKHMAVVNRIEPPQTVPSQLKVLIAEGTPMTMVVIMKFMPSGLVEGLFGLVARLLRRKEN